MKIYTALNNFLSAGSITVPILTPPSDVSGAKEPAEDGWIWFPTAVVGVQDASGTLESLRFLVHHRFVAATYALENEQRLLFIRIYLIPWDLPGSKGELRARDEDAILRPGRRRLKDLFLRIRQDCSLWAGDVVSSSTPKYFWEKISVGCSCLLSPHSAHTDCGFDHDYTGQPLTARHL